MMIARYRQRLTKQPPNLVLYYQPAFFCGFVAYDQEDESDGSGDDDQTSSIPDIDPTIKIWIRHPAEINYDPARATSINLSQTPNWYSNQHDFDIEVDDHVHNHGYTTIGPNFPQAYSSGAVYLTRPLVWKAIKRDLDTCDEERISERFQEILPDMRIIVRWEEVREVLGQPIHYQPVRYHGFYGRQPDGVGHPRLWIVWHPGTWYSAYSSMRPGTHWRPPRKLWIPDSVMCPSDDPKDAVPSEAPMSPIYLEQTYATYVANLDVPKQPSASSEGGAATHKLASSATETAKLDRTTSTLDTVRRRDDIIPPRRRPSTGVHVWKSPHAPRFNLNVISEYTPGEISKIRGVLAIDRCVVVREGETLVDALSAYVTDFVKSGKPVPRFDNLDLIGHSRSRDGILKIGELALTSRVAREQFLLLDDRGILDKLGILAIRLLGCRTASHPRGQRVVRTIRNYTQRNVFATRADLFAVHYDYEGLAWAAEKLLADHDVILNAGVGDLPPRDDYPAPPPRDDDDDDGEDGAEVALRVPPPKQFELSGLSDVNAASVSAKDYLLWQWKHWQFSELANMIYADRAELDNRLYRADYEILLPITSEPRDISDFRSFDLFLCEDKHGNSPRIRVNYDGVSYAFRFRDPDDLAMRLCGIGIAVDDAAQPDGE